VNRSWFGNELRGLEARSSVCRPGKHCWMLASVKYTSLNYGEGRIDVSETTARLIIVNGQPGLVVYLPGRGIAWGIAVRENKASCTVDSCSFVICEVGRIGGGSSGAHPSRTSWRVIILHKIDPGFMEYTKWLEIDWIPLDQGTNKQIAFGIETDRGIGGVH